MIKFVPGGGDALKGDRWRHLTHELAAGRSNITYCS